MNRRSKEIRGFVNFPVDDLKYKNTNEGGMYIILVVIDRQQSGLRRWYQCCGDYCYLIEPDVLIRDDLHPRPNISNASSIEDFDKERQLNDKYEAKYWPSTGVKHKMITENMEIAYRLSHPFLCALVIGSTGWSGANKDDYWYCKLSDLTKEGKQLYKLIKKLYKGCEVRLLTCLDT